MRWLLTSQGNQRRKSTSEVRVQLIVMPEATTEYIRGAGLWRVGLFVANDRDGSGVRHNYIRQMLNEIEAGKELTASAPLRFDLNTDFDMRRVGCGKTRYLCLEFAKGDRPQPDFNLLLANDFYVECQLKTCKGEHVFDADEDHLVQMRTRIIGVYRSF